MVPADIKFCHADTNMRGWWVNPSAQPTNPAEAEAACLVATFMKPYGKDASPHIFYPTPCSARAVAFCKTTVRQLAVDHGEGSSSSSSSGNSSSGSGSSGGDGARGSDREQEGQGRNIEEGHLTL